MYIKAFKFVIFICSIFFTTMTIAENWKNPEAKFNANKLMSDKISLYWHRVDNVQKTCEQESKKRGLGGFGYPISACSFWDKNICEIYTSKSPTLHELGHETRHCFQGNYH